MSFYQWQENDLLLKLHVQTRAKENNVSGIHGDTVKLKISAPPVDNRANQRIIDYIAKEFSVNKSDVKLISGQHHRDKRILIKQPVQLPDWFKRLSDST